MQFSACACEWLSLHFNFTLPQGEWDGLGGMLKQWVRRRMVSALAYDDNDDMEGAVRCPIVTVPGAVQCPEERYEAWKAHFGSVEYTAAALWEGKAVSAFFFHWAGQGDMCQRSKSSRASRARTSSSCMLKPGEVLMRTPACWCSACFDVAERGPSRGTALGSYYTATDCSRPGDELYE